MAMDQALARGWLRQLDTRLHPIFYKGPLNRLTYASWLADNAVRYVALPSAKPDKSSYARARADRERACPTCACAGSRTTGACTRCCCPRRS